MIRNKYPYPLNLLLVSIQFDGTMRIQQHFASRNSSNSKKKRTIALVQGNEATLYSKNERRETGRIEGGIRSVGLNRRTEVAICGDCPHLSSLEERCGHLG